MMCLRPSIVSLRKKLHGHILLVPIVTQPPIIQEGNQNQYHLNLPTFATYVTNLDIWLTNVPICGNLRSGTRFLRLSIITDLGTSTIDVVFSQKTIILDFAHTSPDSERHEPIWNCVIMGPQHLFKWILSLRPIHGMHFPLAPHQDHCH